MSAAKLQSLLQNALVHHRAGRLVEAEALYRQARMAGPRNFEALHLSGVLAVQQQRWNDAIDLLSKAVAVNPKAVACALRLATALMAVRKTAEAERQLRHALNEKGDFHEGWDQLALCLRSQDRLAEALSCHDKAVALRPDFVAGWVNYGFTLRLAGELEKALECHDRALSLAPGFAAARFGRAQALQQLHETEAAVAEYDAYLKLQPQSHEARSNRLFALQNLSLSPGELFAEHVAYGQSLGAPPAPRFQNQPDSERRVRVAFLSPDLRTHSCAYFILPLLRHLPPDQFEVYLYHDHFREDAMSATLRATAAVWRNFAGMSSSAVEQQVRADNPDILVDLAGHTGLTNRLPLFAKRMAPVQVTYLGYPNTTGVAAMDYRFTDNIADPLGADAYATEKLVRFAPTAWAYQPPTDAPDVGAAPCLEKGYVTFGSFNDLSKLTDDMFAVWSELVTAVPNSRLTLKGRGLSSGPVRQRLVGRLERAGIPVARIELLERTSDTASHLDRYREVDIALDTFPYNGTTTTCEALWMGVPVVSLVGDRHMARVGASLVAAAGHPEWATASKSEYVAMAAALAANPERLARTRASLRQDLRAGPLLDHAGQSACFARALCACWANWCEQSVTACLAGAA